MGKKAIANKQNFILGLSYVTLENINFECFEIFPNLHRLILPNRVLTEF